MVEKNDKASNTETLSDMVAKTSDKIANIRELLLAASASQRAAYEKVAKTSDDIMGALVGSIAQPAGRLREALDRGAQRCGQRLF
jgi:hypothetical protein